LIFGQEPETIRIKEKRTNERGSKYKVEFYALKEDPSIMHGEYKKYDSLKDLEETGFYNNGLKHGTWKTYLAGKMVDSVGEYKEGKKEGLWNYYTNIPRSWKPIPKKSGNYQNDIAVGVWTYYKNGEIEQKYDHSNNELVHASEESRSAKFLTKIGGVEKLTTLDRSPMLKGGNVVRVELRNGMNQAKLYHLSNGNSDVAYSISFWIKANGETYNYEVVNTVNAEYDNYIIEYYEANYEWIPGQLDGENVECQVIVSEGYIVNK